MFFIDKWRKTKNSGAEYFLKLNAFYKTCINRCRPLIFLLRKAYKYNSKCQHAAHFFYYCAVAALSFAAGGAIVSEALPAGSVKRCQFFNF